MPNNTHQEAVEAAAKNLHDVIAAVPEGDKPEPWSVFLAIAGAYGPDTDLSFPVKCGGGGPDA